MRRTWDDGAAGAAVLEQLVHRSRLLGADPAIVNWKGGNTSAKTAEPDHTGRPVRVMWIKGSGSDLATIMREEFVGLRLDEVRLLESRDAMDDEEMVDYLLRCLVHPRQPRPSTETLLHAFLPFDHIDHTHPDAVIAFCTARRGEALVAEAVGQRAVWVPYQRPGFALSNAQAAGLYRRAIAVMRGASVMDEFVSLPAQEAYDVEYWPLELYKLTLAPPERELARRVAFVTGAAGGIGRAVAARLAEEGASVVVADIDHAGAQEMADGINDRFGPGRALAAGCDVTDEASVVEAFREAVLTYGGVDILVNNAGIGLAAPLEASAYNAAKAAELHLARTIAEEAGPYGIRVNSVCPDAVLEGSKIWTTEWRRDRARAYGVAPEQLGEFYRQRTTLKVNAVPRDVAEAVLFLASDRSAKTTGAILTVDGGVPGAYVR